MNIIICDDDHAQAEQIELYLSERSEYEIATYHSGAELMAHLPPKCDIAILDIKLQDTLGTTLAMQLKKLYPMVDIILISAYPQYVTAAFHIEASQFLMKPIYEKTFLKEFDRILAQRASRHFRWIITGKGTMYSFFPAEIVFIESYHQHLSIHTQQRTTKIRGKIQDAYQVLESYGFIRCHQGFLVNVSHVKCVRANSILCSNGESIPISSRKRKAFLERYAQYTAAR